MGFSRGDQVEVASKEDGFVGSFYAATVISQIRVGLYIVQYRNLLKEDESGPLRELAEAAEIRPEPPEIPTNGFRLQDKVDVFDNDGWWVGRITERCGRKYFVYFESTGDMIAYSPDRLRIHQDWLNGKWVFSDKRVYDDCPIYEPLVSL